MTKIFISYSRKDGEWLERLKPFLQPLVREDELQVWSDTDIKPSSVWQADIQRALSDADAAILLISQSFLASEYITSNELPQLLSAAYQRGIRIIPIFVSSCFLKKDSPLLRFQGVNSPTLPLNKVGEAEQDEIFVRLAESIYEILTVSKVGVTEAWLEKFRSKFVPVEGGTFVMGDAEFHRELHALEERETRVESFRLGQHVVTQSEWMALMETQPWLNEANVKYGDDVPALNVTWGDAISFVAKINKADPQFAYRLPTEAEWEYAARGGRETSGGPRTRFCFGNDANKLTEYGWHDRNASKAGQDYAHPVGMLKANQLKLFDMHGNIWEWTSEYDDSARVVRGGGFNFEAKGAASAFRLTLNPQLKGVALGFRLVQEPK